MKVDCEVEYADLNGDHGKVRGVIVTCSECEHIEESFGTGAKSVRRCLARMRENCPEGAENYYHADEAKED